MKDKEKRLERIRQQVSRLTDGLGLPVDPGIFETVVALRLHGFQTTFSCEGHTNRASLAPWVDLAPRTRLKFKTKRQCKAYLRKLRPKLAWRLFSLLTEFYRDRNVPFDARLHLEPWEWERLRLVNQGEQFIKVLSKREKLKKHALYQQEMHDFTEFLFKSIT